MFKKVGIGIVNLIYTAVVLAVLAIAFLFVGTKIDLFGYEVKVVKSGSMEPAIQTGGIVVVAPHTGYVIGDVITFGKDTRTHIPVTHRIIEKTGDGQNAVYKTKGDANEDPDALPVRSKDVIGKMVFTIPYLGFVIDYARTPWGFFFLVGLPALFIILDEFANIVWEIKLFYARRRRALEGQSKKKVVREESEHSKIATGFRSISSQKHTKRYI